MNKLVSWIQLKNPIKVKQYNDVYYDTIYRNIYVETSDKGKMNGLVRNFFRKSDNSYKRIMIFIMNLFVEYVCGNSGKVKKKFLLKDLHWSNQ